MSAIALLRRIDFDVNRCQTVANYHQFVASVSERDRSKRSKDRRRIVVSPPLFAAPTVSKTIVVLHGHSPNSARTFLLCSDTRKSMDRGVPWRFRQRTMFERFVRFAASDESVLWISRDQVGGTDINLPITAAREPPIRGTASRTRFFVFGYCAIVVRGSTSKATSAIVAPFPLFPPRSHDLRHSRSTLVRRVRYISDFANRPTPVKLVYISVLR